MRLITPRTNVTTVGRAKTGEVSKKGLVTHAEEWGGRVAVLTQPAPIRYGYNDAGKIRPLTMAEMIDRGYFIIGRGPT